MIRPRIKVGLKPNPGAQASFCNDWRHELVALAMGFRGGKTLSAVWKFLMLVAYNSCPGLIVADSYRNAKTAIVPTLLKVAREAHLNPHWHRGDDVILLRSLGTNYGEYGCLFIILRSAENPISIANFEVGVAWGDEVGRWRVDDEDPERDAFIQMLARCSMVVKLRQILCTGTHEGFSTRLYTEFVEKMEKPDRVIYHGSTLENQSNLGEGYTDMLLSSYDPVLAQQYVYGMASEPGSLRAYYQFDHENIVDVPYQPELPLWSCWDWGVEPLCMVLFQIVPSVLHGREVHVVDEYVMARSANRESLAYRFLADYKDHPGMVYLAGDPSGYARSHRGSVDDWTFMRKAYSEVFPERVRMRVHRNPPRVLDRIARVNAMLCDALGNRHMFINPKCKYVITDMNRVRRKDDGLDKKYDKKLTHASDALGYPLYYEFPPIDRIPLPASSKRMQHQPLRRGKRIYPSRRS